MSETRSGIDDLRPLIESALESACRFEEGCPARLAEAIRYALLAPGKRLRPALTLMAAEACGGTFDSALPGAVAVEMVHAYSLIHDDLPAMDDDDLRRGRPTVHIQFDEATAILAGDALLAEAFGQLARIDGPSICQQAVATLSRAAGAARLVGGQADDLAGEQRSSVTRPNDESSQDRNAPPSREAPSREADGQQADGQQADGQQAPSVDHDPSPAAAQWTTEQATTEQALRHLESIHRRKTGALIAAAVDLGAIQVGATPQHRQHLGDYAKDIGLAFQVVDDLLDLTSSSDTLGKRVGKDAHQGKLTYPGLLGIDGAKEKATQLIESAKQQIAIFGSRGWRLTWLADYVLERTH